jgi:hypothetical protein
MDLYRMMDKPLAKGEYAISVRRNRRSSMKQESVDISGRDSVRVTMDS